MLNYNEFLNENKSADLLKIAGDLQNSDTELADTLNDCEEGVNPAIQIVPTAGATSYIAVALNDGYPLADVYSTSDPQRALLAHIMKNINSDKLDRIKYELSENAPLLKYSVFAGDRKPSLKEVADRFNFKYADFSSDALAFYTSTPISKRY
jgi:hypothetical protein